MPAVITIDSIQYSAATNTPGVALAAGDVLNLLDRGAVINTGDGSSAIVGSGSVTMNIAGDVFSASNVGIFSSGGSSVITIEETSSVHGIRALNINGDANIVDNAGDILGSIVAAVGFGGSNNEFTNSGNIRSGNSNGILFSGGAANTLVNSGFIDAGGTFGVVTFGTLNFTNSGTVRGENGAFLGAPSTLTNTGSILAELTGVFGSASGDTIKNSGTIASQGSVAVDLGSGADLYDGRGGIVGSVLGGDGNDTIFGGAGAETLIGGADNDVIDGGGGADLMQGGVGLDTYVIDVVGDVVDETGGAANEIDLVRSSKLSIDLSNAAQFLGAVENASLTGSASLGLTGNSLANALTGNAGANSLDGGAGADTMVGGASSDTYTVDNVGDVVVEAKVTGVDLVFSTVSFSLAGQYVENLTLTSSTNIDATGNSLANVLTGNGGNNVLDGSTGADTMVGGAGNDTYFVQNAGDKVVEANVAGVDLVFSSVSFATTGQYIENVTLTGSDNVNVTGASLANTLVGNSGANVIDGWTNSDTLTGGAGSDTFAFSTGLSAANVDTITDFSHAADTIRLENAVFVGLTAGALSADALRSGAGVTTAGDVSDRIIYDTTSGALFFDRDGTGSTYAAVRFATLTGSPDDVDRSDFAVI